jgi:Beta-galactosidase
MSSVSPYQLFDRALATPWYIYACPLRLVFLVALSSAMLLVVAQAHATELPTGIYSLTSPGKPVNAAILTNPLVSGVTIRWQWQNVEPIEGVYDWSFFDREIARAANAGKKVLLRIVSGGKNTPSWVFEAGVQTFTFVDPQSKEKTTIPIYWDPIFLEKKKNFIAAMGQHFANNPAVKLVSTSCVNSRTDDWMIPDSPKDIKKWQSVGYTSDKLINACLDIIDATMTAFPNQYVLMGIGRSKNGLDPGADYVASHVVDYAMTDYHGRFVAQKNSLSAQIWDPETSPQLLDGWQLLYDSRPMVAGQMLWYVSNDPTCRMNHGKTPCEPVSVLQEAVTTGAHYEMLYQEIYQMDILNPDLAGVIDYAASVLSAK